MQNTAHDRGLRSAANCPRGVTVLRKNEMNLEDELRWNCALIFVDIPSVQGICRMIRRSAGKTPLTQAAANDGGI
jgi:hypothetical protein